MVLGTEELPVTHRVEAVALGEEMLEARRDPRPERLLGPGRGPGAGETITLPMGETISKKRGSRAELRRADCSLPWSAS
jgi:hypothetical protein